MTEGKRPGGLTALAVLNFIFGGFGVLGTFGFIAMLTMDMPTADEQTKEFAEAFRAWDYAWIYTFVHFVCSVLLIVSGVGYLKQKRFLGRQMGNAYAVVTLASLALWLTARPFELGTIIGLVYPILTLILLNTTFRDDFVE